MTHGALHKPEKSAVVGEDGELLQPDMTVDPDAYAEFVATYVRRDPLWFRMREHVKEWGYAYLFFIPIGLLSIALLLDSRDADQLWIAIGFLALAFGIGYWTLHRDTRY